MDLVVNLIIETDFGASNQAGAKLKISSLKLEATSNPKVS
jgi:hypothetical protein